MLENAWVLHYQEELAESHFKEWMVKSINQGQCNKEIKNWNQFERIHHIYHSVVEIGDALTTAINAGKTQQQILNIAKT